MPVALREVCVSLLPSHVVRVCVCLGRFARQESYVPVDLRCVSLNI